MPGTALVLAGGKALGAFEAGAYQALHEAGVRPDWVVGTSTGAVNSAIIAGNPVERRVEALHRFWSGVATPALPWEGPFGVFGEAARCWAAETHAMAFGVPGVFVPNPWRVLGWGWPAPTAAIGLHDLGPLRRSLEDLVDFERLKGGDVRLMAVAVDVETGEEVVFDTAHQRIGPDHILASSALLGEFPPVEIDGRLFVDGGLRSNLPIDVLRREATHEMTCFAVDLFSADGRQFRNLAEAAMRRQELLLVANGLQFMKGAEREATLRRALRAVLDLVPEDQRHRPEVQAAAIEAQQPELSLTRLVLPSGHEIGVNTYDWSGPTLHRRWKAGECAATEALRLLVESHAQAGAP